MLAFSAIMVLINNSCAARFRGTVNGFGQTIVSLTRLVGPVTGGILFAWSEKNDLPWPLDFHFVWHLIGIIHGGVFLLSFWLPISINKKTIENLPPSPEILSKVEKADLKEETL